jgi:predicted Zn-dependent protease with MMP-like domain
MTRREFEKVVEEAVAGLPELFRGKLENVEFHVAESPNRRQSKADGKGREPQLYGLYEGLSLPDRAPDTPLEFPSRITIFKRAIERDCKSRADMVKCIQDTVLHEIGHHFGFDDAQLDQFGIG